MLSKIIPILPINTGRTGAVMSTLIVGHHGMRIEYHHPQDSMLARRQQPLRFMFVEHKDYTDLNTLPSITATMNTSCVGSPAPSLSVQFSD